MQISTNPTALMAVKAINMANRAAGLASERISTGLRINRASDDPAGMLIANRLKTQITSVAKAISNVSQGVAMTQLVDSSLSQVSDILSNMRVTAVAAANASSDSDAADYQDAMDAYISEIGSIADNATWNSSSLMNTDSTVDIQAGSQSGNTISIDFTQTTASSLGVSSLSVSTTAAASTAIDTIDTAIDTLSQYQSYMGAMANVMTAHSDTLSGVSLAYTTAYGNTVNADMAQETANLASAQIQRDGATAMLAQANGMNKEIVAFLLKSVTG